jgi:hypothetical protein
VRTPLLNRRRRGSVWTPRQLSTLTAWYDPSDRTTLYQDSAGTTPVTAAGQPVGLVLDKSRGLVLGAELVSNGGFDVDASGWATYGTTPPSMSAASGVLTITNNGSTGGADIGFPTTIGRAYKITGTRVGGNSAGAQLRVGPFGDGNTTNLSKAMSAGETYSGYFVATHATTYVSLSETTSTAGQTTTWDNISVRELPGHHLIQATAAKRPTYAIMPQGGVRNLLTRTEEIDNAAWTKSDSIASVVAQAGPRGEATVRKLVDTATVAGHWVQHGTSVSLSVGQVYSQAWDVKAAEHSWVKVFMNTLGFPSTAWANFNLNTGTVGVNGGGVTAAILDLGNGWYRCVVAATCTASTAGTLGVLLLMNNANSAVSIPAYGGSGGGVYVAGSFFGAGGYTTTPSTAYQKVVTSYEVTEAGQPSISYLAFDGVDDALASAGNVDLTGTDAVSVFAGVRKLSDAAQGILLELGTSTASVNGTFGIQAPVSGASFRFASRGSAVANATVSAGYAAPVSAVLTGIGDVSADTNNLRVNGNVVATDPADQGTGNYGSYPLYIGARAGTSLYFNGNLYGLALRGALSTADEIAQADRYLAARTPGVVL